MKLSGIKKYLTSILFLELIKGLSVSLKKKLKKLSILWAIVIFSYSSKDKVSFLGMPISPVLAASFYALKLFKA